MALLNTPSRLAPAWEALSRGDLEILNARGPALYTIQNIRERHHAIARLLVAGYKHTEIQEMLGVASSATIDRLLDSPAFQGLLAEYRERSTGQMVELRARVMGLAEEAISAVHRRFLDTAALDKVPLNRLSEVTFGLLDRAGVGPTKAHTHTFNLSRDSIESIKRAVLAEDAEWAEVSGDSDARALGAGEGEGFEPSAAEGNQI